VARGQTREGWAPQADCGGAATNIVDDKSDDAIPALLFLSLGRHGRASKPFKGLDGSLTGDEARIAPICED